MVVSSGRRIVFVVVVVFDVVVVVVVFVVIVVILTYALLLEYKYWHDLQTYKHVYTYKVSVTTYTINSRDPGLRGHCSNNEVTHTAYYSNCFIL